MVRIVARGEADDGFTFVELVVALTVLAVGIVGVIGVTTSSFRVAGASSSRSKMVAIATKDVEALRAVPYADLEDGYSGVYKCPADPTNPIVDPPITCADGQRYEIERTVWQPSPTATGSAGDKHKRALVLIRWTDQTGLHEAHQQTFLYPGGIGPASGAVFASTETSSCTPAAATSLSAATVLDLVQSTSSIDLAWVAGISTCPVAHYIIQYVTDGSSIVNEVTRLATSTSYRVTGLAAGTKYYFRVAARSASGGTSTWTSWASASTAVWSSSTCQIGTITLTPPAANKKSNGSGAGLRDAVLVTVPTQGTCTGFNAVYHPTDATTRTTPLAKDAYGNYKAYVDKDVAWDVGRRYIEIIRTADTVKVGAVLLTVCEHNVANCA